MNIDDPDLDARPVPYILKFSNGAAHTVHCLPDLADLGEALEATGHTFTDVVSLSRVSEQGAEFLTCLDKQLASERERMKRELNKMLDEATTTKL